MARNTEELKRRQKDIIAALRSERLKHPKWEYKHILREVAKRFYVSEATVIREIRREYA